MQVPFLQPGDAVRLHNGQIKNVKQQEGEVVHLDDGSQYNHLHVSLVLMQPIHLAIHLFNVNGVNQIQRWKWDREYPSIVKYISEAILAKHYDFLRVLNCYGASDYTWKNTFQNEGATGLERVAEEVLRHLDRLVDQNCNDLV